MKRKMKEGIQAFLIVIMLIIGTEVVIGLGVAPASKVIKFEPLLEEHHKIMIVSKGNTKLAISKQGELKDYIHLDKEVIEFIKRISLELVDPLNLLFAESLRRCHRRLYGIAVMRGLLG